MLKIYNTMTRKKEEFKPLVDKNVSMYVCGPTVYDYFHIGNARSFIMSDMIRKYLEYLDYNVRFVMNLTDVDDKIIKKSNTEGVDTNVITQKYIDAFYEDIEKLKVEKATLYPKATEHIKDIVDLIKKLEDKGIAYNVDGNVFYNVEKFADYGKLSGKKLDELESGSRIEINDEKMNPLDFALWKKAKEGEPYWESPWGNGRPGWHIECSAMSCKHLGETFDIHAGGNDLIFPHHENEIAQSEGATGKTFVNYWIHFGFLNIDNEKMSKSLGNFFTTREILNKYPAEVIRFFFAQTHYAGPLNFSDELLAASEKGLEKVQNLFERLKYDYEGKELDGENNFDFEKYYSSFNSAMDDDLNFPQAVAVIFDFVKEINKVLTEEKFNQSFIKDAKEFLLKTAEGIFGIIKTEKVASTGELEKKLLEMLINLRTNAKLEKNYALSDKIRDGLKEIGVTLQDNKEGTSYKIL